MTFNIGVASRNLGESKGGGGICSLDLYYLAVLQWGATVNTPVQPCSALRIPGTRQKDLRFGWHYVVICWTTVKLCPAEYADIILSKPGKKTTVCSAIDSQLAIPESRQPPSSAGLGVVCSQCFVMMTVTRRISIRCKWWLICLLYIKIINIQIHLLYDVSDLHQTRSCMLAVYYE